MTANLPLPVDVAEIPLHPIPFATAVAWIASAADASRSATVCTPNVDYVVRSRRDEAFRNAILACDLRVPDGMWVVYAARLAGRSRLRETVTGRLLLPAVAEEGRRRGWSLALYGAGPGVAQAARDALLAQAPGLDVAAAITPGTPLSIGSAEDLAAVDAIRASGARVVFLGLGAPKQELWMAHHRAHLPGVVLVGTGAAFDIVSGRFRMAPAWMTRVGLEWAFRLVQEPRRLARRYLVDDPWILLWAIRERIRTTRRRVR